MASGNRARLRIASREKPRNGHSGRGESRRPESHDDPRSVRIRPGAHAILDESFAEENPWDPPMLDALEPV